MKPEIRSPGRMLDLGCLTDRQFSEWIKQLVDQALRILTPRSKPDFTRAGLCPRVSVQ